MKFRIYDYENDRSVDLELTASQWKELQVFLKELKNPPPQDYKSVLDSKHLDTCRFCGGSENIKRYRDIAVCRLCAADLYKEVCD